jgi:hypothetical protein
MADGFWASVAAEEALLTQVVARREQFSQQAAQIAAAPDRAIRAVQLTRMAPNASPGVIQAGLALGMDDATFTQFAMLDDGADEDVGGGHGWNLFGYAGDVVSGAVDLAQDAFSGVYEQALKPVLRGVFALGQAGFHEVERGIVSSATALGGGSFTESFEQFGRSPLALSLESVMDDKPGALDLGTGFFPGGEAVEAAQEQRQLQINGQPASLGRLIANNTVGHYSTPGEWAYDVTAGVTQFAGEVFLDPLNLVTGGSRIVGRAARGLGASDETVQALSTGLAGAARRARTITPDDLSDSARSLVFNFDGTLTPAAARQLGGMVSTRTGRSILADEAERLFRDPDLIKRLRDADPLTLLETWDRSPSNSIPYEVLRTIGRSTDEDEIAGALLSAVGRGDLRSRNFYSGWGVRRRSILNSRRYAGVAPTGLLDAEDVGTAIQKVDSQLRQARVGREARAEVLERMLDVQSGDSAGLLDAYSFASRKIAENLEGIDPVAGSDAIRDMTTIWKNDLEGLNHYGVLNDGADIGSPYTRRMTTYGADGEALTVNLPGPQLTSEMNKLRIPMLDSQDIRRAAAKYDTMRKVYKSVEWDIGAGIAHGLTRTLFKPLVLLRPAYILRTGLDDQMRMSASGMETVTSNPWHFIQAYIRNPDNAMDLLGNDLRKVQQARHVLNVDVTGSLGHLDRFRSNRWGFALKGEVVGDGAELSGTYVNAMRVELGQLWAADEAQWLANNFGNPHVLDDFVSWARNDDAGRATLDRFVRNNESAAGLRSSDMELREWGQSILDRIQTKTGGSDDLLRLVTGTHADAAMDGATSAVDDLIRRNVDSLPAKVKAEAPTDASMLRQQTRRFVDNLADFIITKPNNAFARYPTWQQAIHRDLVTLMPAMVDDTLRSRVVEAAISSLNLSDNQITALRSAAQRATGKTGLVRTLDEANELALNHAAETVKDLLFDVSTRSAFQDSFDAIFPFIDAWHEGISVWAGLLKEHPEFFTGAMATLRGAEQNGVLYTAENGVRVFTATGSRALGAFVQNMAQQGGPSGVGAAVGAGVGALVGSRLGSARAGAAAGAALGGVAPAAGQTAVDAATGNLPDALLRPEFALSGVNLMVNGVGPGFGPMVQWAAGAFLPDDETFSGLKEIINPYGSPYESPSDIINPFNVVEGLVPSYMRSTINAMTSGNLDEVQWNTAVHEALLALTASGRYDPTVPEDQNRLTEDATRAARYTLFIRGIAQGTFLTGPDMTWEVKTDGVSDTEIPLEWDADADPNGVWHSIGALASAYRDLISMYGDTDVAHAKFIEMYGIEPAYLNTAKTQSASPLPSTVTGERWMESNRAVVQEYPGVAGYFAPSGDGDDGAYNYSVWRRQLDRGEREFRSPAMVLDMANRSRAQQMFYSIKNSTEQLPRSQRDQLLDRVKASLEEQFPGWQTPVLGVDRLTNDQKISELFRAAQDGALSNNPVAQTIQQYRALRAAALRQIDQDLGLKTFSSDRTKPYRDWLYQQSLLLVQTNPRFAGVWQVFQRELS